MSDTANEGKLASAPTTSGEFDARLKRADENRWLATRYAPAAGRERLVAVYCLNLELQRAVSASEPMLGKIRLQWWREAVAEIVAGAAVRRHELSLELARVAAGDGKLLKAAGDLIDRYDDVIDDHLQSGGHQPDGAHAARHLAAEAALARLAGRALETGVTDDQLAALSLCGEAHLAIRADLPEAGERLAASARAARDLPAALWPAIAHLAVASTGDGKGNGPLLKRWRVLQSVLRRRL